MYLLGEIMNLYLFKNVHVYFITEPVLTLNLLCNKFIVKGHVMSIIGYVRPSFRARSTLTQTAAPPT